MIFLKFQIALAQIPDVPVVDGDAVNSIYAWIIGVLVLAVVGLVTFYERKLNVISTRLNTVIDDSMERMERKNEAKDNAMNKMSEMMLQLKEIITIAKSWNNGKV